MDRRTVWAILLMMVIAIAPALLIKRSASHTVNAPGTVPDSAGQVDSAAPASAPPAAAGERIASPAGATAAASRPAAAPTAAAEDTVAVTSPLYSYGVST